MQYLTSEEAAEHLRLSLRSLHGRTSKRAIPFRRIAGMRRMLFVREELDAWASGANLEIEEKPDGTLIVRPVSLEAVA